MSDGDVVIMHGSAWGRTTQRVVAALKVIIAGAHGVWGRGLIEDETRSSMNYDNLIKWISWRWWSKAPNNGSSRSLHHCSVGYHSWVVTHDWYVLVITRDTRWYASRNCFCKSFRIAGGNTARSRNWSRVVISSCSQLNALYLVTHTHTRK